MKILTYTYTWTCSLNSVSCLDTCTFGEYLQNMALLALMLGVGMLGEVYSDAIRL